MNGADALVASVAVLAVIALGWGGLWLVLKRRDRTRGALMIVAGLVLLANMLIWTWPTAS